VGLRLFPDDPSSAEIIAESDTDGIWTSVSRQDQLFKDGFRFEAAAAQTFLLESLVRLYLSNIIRGNSITFPDKTRRSLGRRRLTLGTMVRALTEVNAFRDDDLCKDLVAYLADRNRLAHSLTLEQYGLDIDDLYRRGRRILFQLWRSNMDVFGWPRTWTVEEVSANWGAAPGPNGVGERRRFTRKRAQSESR